MEWYDKFKVNQKVRVVKKVNEWKYGFGVRWNSEGRMDKTVGRIYTITKIEKGIGFLLSTEKEVGRDYWYPMESLRGVNIKGEQLLFNFMLKG